MRVRTALSCSVLAFIAVAVACQEPTQVTIKITSREQCASLSKVETIVGPDPRETQTRFERESLTGLSDTCDPKDGLIGTLVITPGGDGSGSVLVAVGVKGADGSAPPDPTKCYQPDVAKRCIIARRSFTFIDNKPLVLPIELDPLCVGQSCDPASTCFKGSCVDSNVVCVGSDCGLVQENPGGGGQGEGGAGDAFSGDGAYDAELDGAPPLEDASIDVSPPSDATADTGNDASSIDSGTYPTCGFNDGGPSYFCAIGGTYGTNAPSQCDGGMYCCRCKCPVGAMNVAGCSQGSCAVSCF